MNALPNNRTDWLEDEGAYLVHLVEEFLRDLGGPDSEISYKREGDMATWAAMVGSLPLAISLYQDEEGNQFYIVSIQIRQCTLADGELQMRAWIEHKNLELISPLRLTWIPEDRSVILLGRGDCGRYHEIFEACLDSIAELAMALHADLGRAGQP